jgi:tetratricopeptide (TPR) repeat protein
MAGLATARGGTGRPGIADASRGAGESEWLLVEYFETLAKDSNIAEFRDRVAARYSEDTLCQILTSSPAVTARRASVLALGSLGNFQRSNRVLGRALRDADFGVRRLAEQALWSVWFRADTPENNRALQQVVALMAREEFGLAEALVSRLIVAAPGFAEAYNQRAIIYFQQGRFAESARDCQRVLSSNPYHFGAMGGMAQCLLQLNRPAEALKTLRQASRLRPYDAFLRETIRDIAAQIEPVGLR